MSYQALILASGPIAIVNGASMMAEFGLPRKSVETSGASETARTRPSGPRAAARKASFNASTLTGASNCAVTSRNDTVGTGTRTAYPLILPAMPGSTCAMALGARVVVGTMLVGAERARRRSWSVESTSFWAFV